MYIILCQYVTKSLINSMQMLQSQIIIFKIVASKNVAGIRTCQINISEMLKFQLKLFVTM